MSRVPLLPMIGLMIVLGMAVPSGSAWAVDSNSPSIYLPKFDMPMCRVPGGGEPNGPAYDFWMGRHEVTLGQFFVFLNDAEANPGNERGANMVFDPNKGGDVRLADGNWPDDIFDISDCNSIWSFTPHYTVSYDPNRPVGHRYQFDDPNEADLPVAGVSWIGAVKFCNWLTIDHGLDPNQRCYTEGTRFWDWHPAVISTATWKTRDLNASERQMLVSNYKGFRLPMDNLGLQSGYISGQPNPYNEWYKAAAYDANAPATWRTGAHGEQIPPYHWKYGYGSDLIDLSKGNFMVYGGDGQPDPNCIRYPMPVGFYAATNGNPWGIDDLSGNVYEWGQDYGDSLTLVRHATHSKYWDGAEPASALRHFRVIDDASYFSGLRVVQCGGFSFTLSVVNPGWGQIVVEPNLSTYPPGAVVDLTAAPVAGKHFNHYTVSHPNHPDDANYPYTTPDPCTTILITDDTEVEAAFSCGGGMGPMMPLAAVGLGGLWLVRRRR